MISSLIANLNSIVAKYQHKHLLQTLIQQQQRQQQQQQNPNSNPNQNPFGITSRASESTAASNPSFVNGVATKDIHIDPLSSVSVRIFLPDTVVSPQSRVSDRYSGYAPSGKKLRKVPVVLQFHGGGFVSGSNESGENDLFCRKVAKLWDAVVVSVGYRLAPESKYPAAFEDGVKVLNWLVKQANLGVYGRLGSESGNFDRFGVSMVEPWLAAHGDPSRCVLLGASSGANIANYVAQKAVEEGTRLSPVKIVAQVLMYPFFIETTPSHCETKLATSYFYDKAMCSTAWKLFLPEGEFNLHHAAANPFIPGKHPPLKHMPPTLTVVAEHDLMIHSAIAYSEELRRVNVDAPLLEYKNVTHDFATLGVLLQTPQAQACADDIAIWVKKYISVRGNELSY
ncbi:Probable carboxylesterase 16 [Linum grandiflorum]